MKMIFIETKLFTSLLPQYLDNEKYRELQHYLMERPDADDIIRGSGGIRKLRWIRQCKGKSGGIRIIYYWAKSYHEIFLLTLYSKNEQENIDKNTFKRIAKALESHYEST